MACFDLFEKKFLHKLLPTEDNHSQPKGKKKIDHHSRVVRKPINANPGLKVNQSINFSSIKMFFAGYVLCSLRLFKLGTEGETI